jgi:hypothetical protein
MRRFCGAPGLLGRCGGGALYQNRSLGAPAVASRSAAKGDGRGRSSRGCEELGPPPGALADRCRAGTPPRSSITAGVADRAPQRGPPGGLATTGRSTGSTGCRRSGSSAPDDRARLRGRAPRKPLARCATAGSTGSPAATSAHDGPRRTCAKVDGHAAASASRTSATSATNASHQRVTSLRAWPGSRVVLPSDIRRAAARPAHAPRCRRRGSRAPRAAQRPAPAVPGRPGTAVVRYLARMDAPTRLRPHEQTVTDMSTRPGRPATTARSTPAGSNRTETLCTLTHSRRRNPARERPQSESRAQAIPTAPTRAAITPVPRAAWAGPVSTGMRTGTGRPFDTHAVGQPTHLRVLRAAGG